MLLVKRLLMSSYILRFKLSFQKVFSGWVKEIHLPKLLIFYAIIISLIVQGSCVAAVKWQEVCTCKNTLWSRISLKSQSNTVSVNKNVGKNCVINGKCTDLEKFKNHVIEMWWHVHHLHRLSWWFSWREESPNN